MLIDQYKKPPHNTRYRTLWQYIHVDVTLLSFLILLCTAGLVILYSASNQVHTIELQAMRLLFGFVILLVVAQISPFTLQRYAPLIYFVGLTLLIAVLIAGHIGKGAQRWLNLGFMRFQPAELMKVGIPLILAWYYHQLQLPITLKSVLVAIPIIVIPAVLTAKQPDLSTAILLTIAGASILFLAGLSWRIILSTFAFLSICIPFAWHFLH